VCGAVSFSVVQELGGLLRALPFSGNEISSAGLCHLVCDRSLRGLLGRRHRTDQARQQSRIMQTPQALPISGNGIGRMLGRCRVWRRIFLGGSET
ncbi:hypothetical protein ACIQUM_29905, partial [Amycolatopsis azurea]|uniref:hypothetical protein n=1 Tax=Amycolatopsis azurea TaxID=36819 RepID=UPI00382F5A2F